MTDKDILTAMLTVEKELVKNYAVAVTESSNDELCEDLTDMFNDAKNMQRNVFNLMYNKGLYPLQAEDENTIQQKLIYLDKEFNQISNT